MPKKFQAVLYMFLLMLAFLTFLVPSKVVRATPKSPQSTFCQCVPFVQNYFGGYSLPQENALDWAADLPNYGWVQDSSPILGDIVTIQPGQFAGSVGHVAILNDTSGNSIQLLGANQPGVHFSFAGCDNASYWGYFTPNNTVRFWYYGPWRQLKQH